jgi:hypothetical protein
MTGAASSDCRRREIYTFSDRSFLTGLKKASTPWKKESQPVLGPHVYAATAKRRVWAWPASASRSDSSVPSAADRRDDRRLAVTLSRGKATNRNSPLL